MKTITIKTDVIAMDLVERLAEHKGWTLAETLAWCADAGVRRLAALDRSKVQAWAGKADKSRPAPGRATVPKAPKAPKAPKPPKAPLAESMTPAEATEAIRRLGSDGSAVTIRKIARATRTKESAVGLAVNAAIMNETVRNVYGGYAAMPEQA